LSRHVTNMTIDDAEHWTEEERAEVIASYLPHEREARAKGIPTMGSGRVFPIAEEQITCVAFAIPEHWVVIGGMDFGWDHPFAAVRLVWDRDADIVYVTNAYKMRQETPVIHSASIKPWGETMPWAWPHDGLQHDKGSGLQLKEQYKKQGLTMLKEKATHEAGGFGTEAGVMDMLERMQTGRLKVFSHLAEWFFEFRLYHRQDGKIVKVKDDLMSATRIGLMMLREAQPLKAKSWNQGNSKWVV
jgi:Terminase RNaseH-like domain/Terminase large subunit, T4likevirus-type, N-terminal